MSKILDNINEIIELIPPDIVSQYSDRIKYIRTEFDTLEKNLKNINQVIKEYLKIKFTDKSEQNKRRDNWNNLEFKDRFESIWKDIKEIMDKCSMLTYPRSDQLEEFDKYIQDYINDVINYFREIQAHKELSNFKNNMIVRCEFMLKEPDITSEYLKYCYVC